MTRARDLSKLGDGHFGSFVDAGSFSGPTTVVGGHSYRFQSATSFYLESAPSDGATSRITLYNPVGSFSINPNGKKINNSTAALTVQGGQTIQITYDATTGDWE